MCIWKVSENERMCMFCTYMDGCEKRPPQSMASWFIDVMNGIVGGDILDNDRRKVYVWARNIVAYQLRRMGMTQEQIGSVMGLNHSTVHHCLVSMEKMLTFPKMYSNEYSMYNEFLRKI